MRDKKVYAITICAISIAMNIVLGTVVTNAKIPLIFLDTIGTIFAAVIFGPWYGAAVGAITNILTPLLSGNVKDIPFLIVNVAVGLIVGFIAKRYKFNLVTAVITGIILAIVCPIIGTPIAVWVYGGLTGSGNDFIFLWLKSSGQSIFTSALIPRITGNFIDKIASCVLVVAALRMIPSDLKSNYDQK